MTCVVPSAKLNRERNAVPEGQVLMEKRRTDGTPAQDRDPGGIDQRRLSRVEQTAQGGPARPQLPIRQRVARHSEHPGPHARLHRQEDRPVIGAKGLAEVEDPGGVQVVLPVAVHVHPDLDDPHELHQVCGGLPNAVGEKDDVPWRGRGEALVAGDHAVTILVDPTTARGERHRPADGLADRQRAERAEAVPDRVDGDGRDAVRRHRAGDGQGRVFLVGAIGVAENRHGPPTGRRRA